MALSIDPNFVPALFNLAIAKTADGDLASAIHLYQRAIKVEPSYAEARLNLGFALIQNGQKKEGNTELAKAVQLDPSLASRIPANQPTDQGGQQGGGATTTPTGTASPS